MSVIFDQTFLRKTDNYDIDNPQVRCRVEASRKPYRGYADCEHYTVKVTDESGRSLIRAKTFRGESAWSESKRYASDAVGKHTYGMEFMAVEW